MARCGYEAHREYYLNDRGVQMGLFAASLAARKAGEDVPDDGYVGDYISEWAAEMPDDADPRAWGYERVKRDLRDSLAAIGVEFDTWSSEQDLADSGAVDAALDDLRAHGVVYDADGAVWLRTTDFGDDKDRVIVKSDGEPTYVLPDVAYHRDKFARGFELLIDVWGADHHGYVSRLKAGVQALGHEPDELEIILGQLVQLVRGGEEVRLSKRAGTLVLLDDLVGAVGPDVARLTFLLQSLDTRQTIDLDLITAQSNENPVFYVQYANARIHSIGRKASRGRDRAGAAGRRRPVAAGPRAGARPAAQARGAARGAGPGVRRPGPAQGHHLGARAGRPLPRLLPRLLRDRRRPPGAHAGPALAGRGGPDRTLHRPRPPRRLRPRVHVTVS